jgi:ATP-binding cassette subfamily B protein
MKQKQLNIPLKPYWDLLATYLKQQRGRTALLGGLLLGNIGLQLANPQIVRYFLDTAETGRGLDKLFGAAALFISIAIVRQMVNIAATYVGENVAWTATNLLRADLALHCLKLDMSFHKKYKPGELIERVDGDVNQLANFFSQLVIQLGGNLLLVSGVLVLLWLLDWRVGLALASIAIPGLLALRWLNQRVVPRWQAVRQADADLFGYLEEWLNGTEEIRASGAGPYVMRKLYQLMRQRYLKILAAMRVNVLISDLPIGVFALAYVAAHILGNSIFRNGAITIGGLYLIFYYIDLMKGPLWEILRQVEELQRATASINRLAELRQVQPTIHDGAGVAFPAGALAVEFDRVSFYYEDDPDTMILDGLHFGLKPGTVLGLLGRTGSGKSTLARLLFRFYDPTAGAIRLGDGRGQMFELRQARQAELRQRIGLVTQEVQLFRATVRHNLTLFDDSIDDERIRQVVATVGLKDWLAALPAGLDTQLEAGSAGLSAGEGQLLAFARVFLADPGLVILDEASSRLDPATEGRIERAVDRLLTSRTGIIVAHRLSTVQRADEIMILEDGRICEHGRRADLAGDPNSRFYGLLQTGLEEALA